MSRPQVAARVHATEREWENVVDRERITEASGRSAPHTARHTFATRWRRRGLAIDEIQILLGHSSARTTADLYVHARVEDVAEHMALIEAQGR
jgi:integrase